MRMRRASRRATSRGCRGRASQPSPLPPPPPPPPPPPVVVVVVVVVVEAAVAVGALMAMGVVSRVAYTRWGYTRCIQLNHSLKAPGFNP
jgi:hypothetical protein